MPCCSSQDKHSRHCGVMGTFSPISSKLLSKSSDVWAEPRESMKFLSSCDLFNDLKRPSGEKSFRFLMLLFFVHVLLLVRTRDTLFTFAALVASVHILCTRAASGVLLNERQWEAAVLPQGRPCSTLVRVAYATAITIESKENVSGWCLKGLSGFCLPCRRMMMKMIAGCVHFETFLTSVICWTCLDVTWICSILYKTLIFFDLIKMTAVGRSCIFLWY